MTSCKIHLLVAILSFIVRDSFCFGGCDSHQKLASFIGARQTLFKPRQQSTIIQKNDIHSFKSIVGTQLGSALTASSSDDKSVGASSTNIKDVLAKLAGYVMGTGALVIYTPILLTLLKRGNAVGFSLATWVYTLVGMATAIAYPMKKGFPISTYTELIGAALQSIVILGLICFYESKLKEFVLGVGALAAVFVTFLKVQNIPPNLLGLVQIAASLLANYANVPQIILTFQTKKASWSGITAFLSIAGCVIRILTTLQLTKDPFVIAGYILGVVTNGILLAQVLIYK